MPLGKSNPRSYDKRRTRATFVSLRKVQDEVLDDLLGIENRRIQSACAQHPQTLPPINGEVIQLCFGALGRFCRRHPEQVWGLVDALLWRAGMYRLDGGK